MRASVDGLTSRAAPAADNDPMSMPEANQSERDAVRLTAVITAKHSHGQRLPDLGADGETELALAALAGGGALLIPLLSSSVITLLGPDAAAFLHGQVANDVSGLPSGGVSHTLLLNHKGHALAEASVLRRDPDDLLVVVDDGRGYWAAENLKRHIIFDEVELGDDTGQVLLTLQGPGAARLLGAAPQEQRSATLELHGATVTAYPRQRSAAGGYDLLVATAELEQVLSGLLAAGAVGVGERALDAVRVHGAVASAAFEGGDGVLPQEAGLEAALSYQKGCYLGQEIMARIEARGKLRRGLRRLTLAATPDVSEPELRAITSGGRRVGLLGTVAEFEGEVQALAVLRLDLGTEAELEVAGVAARLLEDEAVTNLGTA